MSKYAITREFLRQIYADRKKLVEDIERLRDMRERALCIPSASGNYGDKVQKTHDNRGNYWVDMATDLEAELTERDADLHERTLAVSEWIKTIDDVATRQVMAMRYVQGLQWSDISMHLRRSDRRVYQLHSAVLATLPETSEEIA